MESGLAKVHEAYPDVEGLKDEVAALLEDLKSRKLLIDD